MKTNLIQIENINVEDFKNEIIKGVMTALKGSENQSRTTAKSFYPERKRPSSFLFHWLLYGILPVKIKLLRFGLGTKSDIRRVMFLRH